MDNIRIIPVKLDAEILEIVKLGSEIWKEHYTSIIGKEQVQYMLQKFQSYNAIKKQIDEGFYYFLVQSDQPIGYFSILPKTDCLFLSKFYLLNIVRGKNIGSKMMEFVENKAYSRNLKAIELTVNKFNNAAIKFYEKLNFQRRESAVFDIGNGFVMDDYVMEKVLS